MKEKKDILILCQYFYPEYITSATLPYDTAEELVKAGFNVSALCGYPKEYNNSGQVPLKENYKAIEINRVRYLQLRRTNAIYRLINYFSFTFAVLLRLFKLGKYKAIIVYSNPPILPFVAAIGKIVYKTRMIFVSHDVYPEIATITNAIGESSIINKIMKLFNKVIFKCADKVVALSNEMKEYLLKHRPILDEDKVDVIPNWYKDEEFNDIAISYENEMFNYINPEKDFIVSYFGNMGIAQDLDTIIGGMKGLKEDQDVKFMFIGHGNKMDKLRRIIESESLDNVNIFDFIHGEDFQDALNISDCFIVSLGKDLTGLAVPSKTYSYMMAGKPIIAIIGKDSDIARDLVENEAGYAIEVGEVDDFINAINEMKIDKEKRYSMGERCRLIFLEKYTKEICTQKYVEMIKEILGEEAYACK